jgi:exosortase/archaeosortase family protein
MKQKKVFGLIFAVFAILLIILPFIVSFNDFLTRFIESIKIYTWIQTAVVPYEVGMVRVMVSIFGIFFTPYANGMMVNGTFLEMTWNCIGWQSLLLLILTIWVGLGSGNYTLMSKIEVIAIGFLGTFLMNLLRLSLIVIIWAYARPIYFYVYHDYLSAIATAIWLFIFWWFSYKYVLREK